MVKKYGWLGVAVLLAVALFLLLEKPAPQKERVQKREEGKYDFIYREESPTASATVKKSGSTETKKKEMTPPEKRHENEKKPVAAERPSVPRKGLDPAVVEEKIERGELDYERDRHGYAREFYSPSGRYAVSVIVPKPEENKEVSSVIPPAVPVVRRITLPDGEVVNFAIKTGKKRDRAIVKVVDKETGETLYEPLPQVEQQEITQRPAEGEEQKPAILPPPPLPSLGG